MDMPSILGNASLKTDSFGQGGQDNLELNEKTVPILSGENLSVLTPSDFEQLLSLMDMENADHKQKSFITRIDCALTILAGRYATCSAAQKAAIDKVDCAVNELKQLETDCKKASELAFVEYQVLEAMNKELEAMLEAEVTTPEERKENVDEANEKAAEGAEEVKQEKTDETEQKEESPEVKAKRAEIAAQEEKVKAMLEDVSNIKVAMDAATVKVNEAFQELDAVGLRYMIEAAILAAKNLIVALDEQPEATEKKEELNPMIEALSEYVDKIQEMQDEELREVIAKVAQCVIFVETTDPTVDMTNFPEYEKRV